MIPICCDVKYNYLPLNFVPGFLCLYFLDTFCVFNVIFGETFDVDRQEAFGVQIHRNRGVVRSF